VGLRDRALMAVMTYTFARISAVVGMRVEDYFANGKRWWVRLHEKGGRITSLSSTSMNIWLQLAFAIRTRLPSSAPAPAEPGS
jgi:site-specific recombinase XerD